MVIIYKQIAHPQIIQTHTNTLLETAYWGLILTQVQGHVFVICFIALVICLIALVFCFIAKFTFLCLDWVFAIDVTQIQGQVFYHPSQLFHF